MVLFFPGISATGLLQWLVIERKNLNNKLKGVVIIKNFQIIKKEDINMKDSHKKIYNTLIQ
jgi:hypothetical protein